MFISIFAVFQTWTRKLANVQSFPQNPSSFWQLDCSCIPAPHMELKLTQESFVAKSWKNLRVFKFDQWIHKQTFTLTDSTGEDERLSAALEP